MKSKNNLREFLGEVGETIEGMKKMLENLRQLISERKGADNAMSNPLIDGIINSIFRSSHSLTGISALFGFAEMTQLSQALETLTDKLRMGNIELTPEILDLLDESINMLQEFMEPKGFKGLLRRLERTIKKPEEDIFASAGIGENILTVLTEYEEYRLEENILKGKRLYRIRATFGLNRFDEGLGKLQKKAKQLGELITTLPSAEVSSYKRIAFLLLLGSRHTLKKVQKELGSRTVKVKQLQAPAKKKRSEKGAKKTA